MRNVYIENKDPKEALSLYLENLDIKASTEEISLRNALNRISSEPIFSKISSPQNHLAAMDGICVNSSITSLASEINPLKLYENKDFIYVNTGNVIPDRFDSVIMIEDVLERDGFIEIISPSKPWQHIRPIGEDIVKGEMVIPSNYKIDSFALGSLAASGNFKVKVYKNPTVSILVTGSEIVSSLENANKGTIIDSNSYMLSGLVSEFGGNPIIYEPIPDIYESIKSEIISAVKKSDIVIINAGSSAGTHDYTVHIIRELGKVFTHGVALKPGKPTILGEIEGTPVIGIPGYPVSAYVSFKEFVVPVINSFLNKNISYQNKIEGILTKKIPSSFKYRELVRVNTGIVNNKIIATPIARGAGITTSLLKADGIIEIDRSLEGLNTGDKVEISLLKPIEKIKENILSIGSHDILMDILRDFIPITSSHVGSLGGIMALKQNQCHLAPIHLLDSKTGEYNISYVKQYFKEPMILIKGVKRIQGFMVKKGNPKNITSIKDLTNPNIKFVNRQRGAGTRILLDFLLSQNNISKDQIIGYEREMLTHMSVAAEVNSNKVDVGLGVYSAAKEMNLDFIPVGNEEYDFLIKKSSLEFLSPFIKALKSKEFKAALENLGGYEFTNSGELIYINEH
ncbi:molybdenum cofactor synthesis domain-containing protein [Clostridium thermobutyricum]|uniref:Molybdopterin molybdenumtransferase n=1 Tax=Clostridium thermobutyricum TaxID=29372 RepID=N9Y2I0_9CLOT|nr:molybdopterin biosynthesis protein [Clostridium thermobutyricum]ENZ02037.1 molybdenum cofactor synthesis domain-containing protein [Clostridium thermobutyricum]